MLHYTKHLHRKMTWILVAVFMFCSTCAVKVVPFKKPDQEIAFACAFVTDADYTYDIQWFIHETKVKDVQGLAWDNGEPGWLLESDWKTTYKMNFEVSCASVATNILDRTNQVSYTSYPYYAGLMIYPRTITITETETGTFTIRTTVPIGCDTHTGCNLEVLVATPRYQDNGGRCRHGIQSTDLKFDADACGVEIQSSDWARQVQLTVGASTDGIYNKPRSSFVKMTTSNVFFHDIWSNINLPDVQVNVIDADVTTAHHKCRSNNDPHMRTFDRKSYEMQKEGEFVLYEHISRNIQVNALYRRCRSSRLVPTCNCGMAILSRNSQFIVNVCGATDSDVNNYIVKRGCFDDDLIYEINGGNIKVTLPTGTYIYASLQTRRDILRRIGYIHIRPSPLDRGKTRGLCGTFTSNQNDDWILRDGTMTQDKTAFALDWSVSTADSLFNPNYDLTSLQQNLRHYCQCTDEASVMDSISDFNRVHCNMTEDIQLCTEWVNPLPTECSGNRKKREAGSDVLIKYEPQIINSDIDTKLPDWGPTWTEQTASAYCTERFMLSRATAPCSEYIGMTTDVAIDECILDIKYVDDTSYTEVTIDAFKNECLDEVTRTIELADTESETPGISVSEWIEGLLCPSDCSGQGRCEGGSCHCESGFIGDDCSAPLATPPNIISSAISGLCDTTVRPCQVLQLYVGEVWQQEVTCKFQYFDIAESGPLPTSSYHVTSGTAGITGIVMCPFPSAASLPESTGIADGYHVTLSYDGINFGTGVSVAVYDGSRVDCAAHDACTVFVSASATTIGSTETTVIQQLTQETTTTGTDDVTSNSTNKKQPPTNCVDTTDNCGLYMVSLGLPMEGVTDHWICYYCCASCYIAEMELAAAEWSDWTGCSATCGPGEQLRHRVCVPSSGADCAMMSTRQTKFCYQMHCNDILSNCAELMTMGNTELCSSYLRDACVATCSSLP